MKRFIANVILIISIMFLFPICVKANSSVTQYNIGDSKSAESTSVTDQHKYNFSLTRSGQVTVQITSLDTFKNLNFRIMCNGETIKYLRTGGSGGYISAYLMAGNYTIQFDGFSVDNIPYTFTSSFTSSNESYPESLSNQYNSFETARNISLLTEYKGQIADYSDDADYYYFSLSSPSRIQIEGTSSFRYKIYNSNRISLDNSTAYPKGIYYLKITEIGNYNFRVVATATVMDLSAASITLEYENVYYDGYPKCPKVKVEYGANTLVEGVDYITTYSDNVEPGNSAKVSITGIGDYCGNVIKYFYINYKQLGSGDTFTFKGNTYELLSSGYLRFSKAGNTGMKSITIPGSVYYNGTYYSVTEIGKNAFIGCKNLSKVTIQNTSFTKIGEKAFYNCRKLKTVKLSTGSLKFVGKNAFKGTNKKLKIKITYSYYLNKYKRLLKKGGVKSNKVVC